MFFFNNKKQNRITFGVLELASKNELSDKYVKCKTLRALDRPLKG